MLRRGCADRDRNRHSDLPCGASPCCATVRVSRFLASVLPSQLSPSRGSRGCTSGFPNQLIGAGGHRSPGAQSEQGMLAVGRHVGVKGHERRPKSGSLMQSFFLDAIALGERSTMLRALWHDTTMLRGQLRALQAFQSGRREVVGCKRSLAHRRPDAVRPHGLAIPTMRFECVMRTRTLLHFGAVNARRYRRACV